jgi:hypothetical protein
MVVDMPFASRLAPAFSQERTGVPYDEIANNAHWHRNIPLYSPPIFKREDNSYRKYNSCNSGPHLPTSPRRAMSLIPVELPLSPMRTFLCRIELDRLTGIQRPFHPNVSIMVLHDGLQMSPMISRVMGRVVDRGSDGGHIAERDRR